VVFTKRLGLGFILRGRCITLHDAFSQVLELSFHYGKSLDTMKSGQAWDIGFVVVIVCCGVIRI